MKASVLVVGYRQADIIPYLLRAYDLQSFKDFEVIYVENGAGTDERGIKTLKEVKTKVALKKIVNHKNENIGLCWNMAAKQAQGDLLIFTAGNIIPDHFLVESYVKANDENHILAGVKYNIDPTRLFLLEMDKVFEDYAKKWNWHQMSRMVWGLDITSRFMTDITAFGNRPYYLVSGKNMAIPRKAFEQVSGASGHLKDGFPSDWHLALKVWADGYEFKHVPGAIAFQVQKPGDENRLKDLKQEQIKEFHRMEKDILGKLK